jgi:hypothetical protein
MPATMATEELQIIRKFEKILLIFAAYREE